MATLASCLTSVRKCTQRCLGYKKPSHVHVAPLPDQYRGRHHYSDEDASIKYAAEVKSQIAKLESEGRRLAAFICEPYFVESGVHPPTSQYYQQVYSAVRAHGGLVIADESRNGLGRTGEHMWGFQSFGVVPDIVTIGRSMSNGYPMGAVICSREVSERLGGYFSTFGGNPVACAIGLTVLEVIANEKLMSSAKMVGRSVQLSLQKLVDKHECLGDIRGSGLIWAIEIVNNKRENKPEPKLATEIMYRLKGKQVLVDLTGKDQNVILFSPPMCFTMENGRVFTKCLDEVLTSTSNRAPELPSPADQPRGHFGDCCEYSRSPEAFHLGRGDRGEAGEDGGNYGGGELRRDGLTKTGGPF